MLVVSRHPDQTVVFAEAGIRVRVLGCRGNTVRLGIEAPPGVRVLRDVDLSSAGAPTRTPDKLSHRLRNELNKISLGLFRLEQEWDAGMTTEARASLAQVVEVLDRLEGECAAPAVPVRQTLVVEDDANERELLSGILRLKGCACDAVADGREALDYLSSHERPDLVLLDLGLPRCSGAQTVAEIRRDPRYQGLKVFAISGTAPADLGLVIGPTGVDAWFPKPLNPRTLWEAVAREVESPAAVN